MGSTCRDSNFLNENSKKIYEIGINYDARRYDEGKNKILSCVFSSLLDFDNKI